MNVQENLTAYLLDTMGLDPGVVTWEGSANLPPFLNDLYTFGRMDLHDRPYVLAFPCSGFDYTPAAVEKHFARIRDLLEMDVVYVADSLPGWNRKRFIEKRISFIIPGNQMYLPLLGFELREHVRLPSKKIVDQLSPSSQEIALYVLNNNIRDWTGNELAEECTLSLMTVHRAFDELGSIGAFIVRMDGKRRILAINESRKKTWELLQPVVKNPIARTIVIPRENVPSFAVIAGLSALAVYSDIAPPEVSEFAVKMSTWNKYVKKTEVPIMSFAEEGMVRVQLWRHDPRFNNDSTEANILSVILTLQDFDDERVTQAIEKVLKEALC